MLLRAYQIKRLCVYVSQAYVIHDIIVAAGETSSVTPRRPCLHVCTHIASSRVAPENCVSTRTLRD
jgi:hypothetical protein